MATRLPKTRRTNHVRSERVELAERLASFKPKTKLGAKLLTLSKQGLEDGEPLLDADGITKELGRGGYEKQRQHENEEVGSIVMESSELAQCSGSLTQAV